MTVIKAVCIYFKKRKGVFTKVFYFSAGFVVSLWLMMQSYPHGGISKQVKYYDLKEDHIIKPLEKGSVFLRRQACINI